MKLCQIPVSRVKNDITTLPRIEGLYFCTHASSTNTANTLHAAALAQKPTFALQVAMGQSQLSKALQHWHKRAAAEINGNFLTELMRGDPGQHQSHLY